MFCDFNWWISGGSLWKKYENYKRNVLNTQIFHRKTPFCEYELENLQKIEKYLKKGVDKWESFWYSNQALKRAGQKAAR